jgi:futalosine hydrolase
MAEILLVSATAGESRALACAMTSVTRAVAGRKPVLSGQLAGRACKLAVSGMGAVNAAHALTIHLEQALPQVVIQVGIGGAYVPARLPAGAVAIATEENYGDVGVMTRDGWLPSDAIGIPLVEGEPPLYNRFPLDDEVARRAAGLCGATAGPFLTLAQCTGIGAVGDALFERFGAICESMEGAAAAHVCAIYRVPFLEVRGISNLVEDRDRSKWRIPEAAAAAQAAVLHILEHLDEVLRSTADNQPTTDGYQPAVSPIEEEEP